MTIEVPEGTKVSEIDTGAVTQPTVIEIKSDSSDPASPSTVVVDVAGREKTDITVTVIEKPNIQEVNVKVNDVDTPILPISG